MKKGFTIIEIIISITLILIVGTSTTFFVLSKKNNNELEIATKEILEAASAYVKIEKDKNGRIYANEIVRGAKGVKVPLTNLVKSGYIKEEQVNKIYENNLQLENNQDYYVMFVQESEEVNYCSENEITSYVSWMPKGESIYLCDSYITGEEDINVFDYLLSFWGGPEAIEEKNTIVNNVDLKCSSMTTCASFSCTHWGYFGSCVNLTNGLFKRIENDELIYYYRGNINNNYLMIKDVMYRIISFSENKIRIIKEEPITTYNSNNFKNYVHSEVSIFLSQFDGYPFMCYYSADSSITSIFLYYNYNMPSIIGNISSYSTSTEFSITFSEEKITYEGRMGALPNIYDVLYAGIPLSFVGKYTNGYFSDSWLSSGGNIYLSTEYNSDDLYVVFDKDDQIKQIYTEFFSLGYWGSIFPFNYLEDSSKNILRTNSVRPVTELNIKNINISGFGTKTSPFVVTPNFQCDY